VLKVGGQSNEGKEVAKILESIHKGTEERLHSKLFMEGKKRGGNTRAT